MFPGHYPVTSRGNTQLFKQKKPEVTLVPRTFTELGKYKNLVLERQRDSPQKPYSVKQQPITKRRHSSEILKSAIKNKNKNELGIIRNDLIKSKRTYAQETLLVLVYYKLKNYEQCLNFPSKFNFKLTSSKDRAYIMYLHYKSLVNLNRIKEAKILKKSINTLLLSQK